MDIDISSEIVEEIKAEIKEKHIKTPDEFKPLLEGVRYGSKNITLDVSELRQENLDKLYDVAKKFNDRSVMMLITALNQVRENPTKNKCSNLRALPDGLIKFFLQDLIDGWAYYMDGDIPIAYLIRDIEFHEGSKRDKTPDYVTLELSANSHRTSRGDSSRSRHRSGDGLHTLLIHFEWDDLVKKSIPEVLALKGILHETPELKAAYEKSIKRFFKFRPMYGKQFIINNGQMDDEDDTYSSKSTRVEIPHKLVNDEEIRNRSFQAQADNRFWTGMFSNGIALGDKLSDKFTEIPYHPYVYMFNLKLHENVWIHVDYLEIYKYDTSLKYKLILPDSHRDLIDILTTDMDVLMDDIIAGKSGGTSIMCIGKPGLGKTLTAECYSEGIEKPLYSVHSGQLGTTVDDIRKNLETILKRSERWGAILLLDEADVYIRRRGDDLDYNAIVAEFLRTLEYFHGLLFMTTNLDDSQIDDAILSRCIAVVKYETPTTPDAKKIWRVLADQFEIAITDKFIAELAEHFSSASGRDIKGLLRLTSKFCKHKKIPLTLEAFRQCAQFRGL